MVHLRIDSDHYLTIFWSIFFLIHYDRAVPLQVAEDSSNLGAHNTDVHLEQKRITARLKTEALRLKYGQENIM